MRKNCPRKARFSPSREIKGGISGRQVGREYRFVTSLSVDAVDEELFESRYPAQLSKKYGKCGQLQHSCGDILDRLLPRLCGLHIDEAYRKVIESVDHSPYLRKLVSQKFLETFGQKRLKRLEDGTRKYGEGMVPTRGGQIWIDNEGILRKTQDSVTSVL